MRAATSSSLRLVIALVLSLALPLSLTGCSDTKKGSGGGRAVASSTTAVLIVVNGLSNNTIIVSADNGLRFPKTANTELPPKASETQAVQAHVPINWGLVQPKSFLPTFGSFTPEPGKTYTLTIKDALLGYSYTLTIM